jgi:hypothetical protein
VPTVVVITTTSETKTHRLGDTSSRTLRRNWASNLDQEEWATRLRLPSDGGQRVPWGPQESRRITKVTG